MENFVNICDIHEWIQNDGLVLIKKLMEFGMLPKTYPCEKCGTDMTLKVDNSAIDKYKWRCRNYIHWKGKKSRRCEYSASLRKDTFFHRSHLTLGQITKFICCWVDNMPLTVIKKQTRIIGQATLVDFGNFCREVIFDKIVLNGAPIGGEGKIVEIDESKFGKRKHHRGHKIEGQWVFGGFERDSGKVFMVPVEKRDRSTLLPLIQTWILPGTEIHSDCWKAYDTLSKEGYEHLKVNHSITFVDPKTGACTNHIEASWRAAKSIYASSGRRKAFFYGYLSKYLFLKSCRVRQVDPFIEFCKAAGYLYNPTRKSNEKNDNQDLSDSDDDDHVDGEEEIIYL